MSSVRSPRVLQIKAQLDAVKFPNPVPSMWIENLTKRVI